MPESRRGAAADQYGNWYWIDDAERRIFWQPSGSRRPAVYWQEPSRPALLPGAFGPVSSESAPPATLRGLTVTTGHYLIVGNASRPGLFRFDLHAGGEPLLVLIPSEIPFAPFDMAPAPDGGIWLLDREHQRYWGFDRDMRAIDIGATPAEAVPPASLFQPVGGIPLIPAPATFPAGFQVAAQRPLAIEGLPDGTVLILDEAPDVQPTSVSIVYHYRGVEQVSAPRPLRFDVEQIGSDGESTTMDLSIAGHDLAYSACTERLFIADRGGKQVFALAASLDAPLGATTIERDYLPLHYFGSRALIAHDNAVFYDVVGGDVHNDANVRWIALQPLDQPRFDRSATLVTQVLDGHARDCVWDRLYLDACIPAGAGVAVWTRAHNELDLLNDVPFTREPDLYLRGMDAEVPFYDPFADLKTHSPETGTWELLFQRANGRFLQIQLDLSGNGRVSPQLRALRAWYPRFSLSRRYLPAIYGEDAESGAFLERLLANPHGFFTLIEGQMRDVSVLFDARSAPSDALDWLAGWVGLMLDPLWEQIQQRRQLGDVAVVAHDRRRLFIRFAMRLYQQRGTVEGIQFALQLLLDPCLETTLQRFKDGSVRPNPGLAAELARLGLPYPTPVMSEEAFEDLLHDYTLSPRRPSKVRIVERFLTRGGRALVAGDASEQGQASDQETVAATAHRFSVLVPEDLSSEEAAMVERVVELEKPAHTLFDVRRYWDAFRVGEARLEIDTLLGEAGRFRQMILGRDYLAEGYLTPAYPMDIAERMISDRDGIQTPRL
jgi:phage tail-like protein